MTLYDVAPSPYGLDATSDVPGRPVEAKRSLWDMWDDERSLPLVRVGVITVRPPKPKAAPRAQRELREIRQWTRWSARSVGELLGTTHPTIAAIAAGRSSFARVPGLPSRLFELHGLLERLNAVADEDPVELNRLLESPPGPGQRTALECVAAYDFTSAWLAAIDVASPRREGGMMRGLFPARAGEATAALHE